MMRRPERFFVLVLGLAILLAVVESAAVALRARLSEAGRGACWIWASGVHDSGEPVAFFAVRDVELEALGEHAAELIITADESYIAYVNGRRVGAGAYRPGAPADLYDVTAELVPGRNRLAVEVMSRRGAGGLLASLRAAGRTALMTDADWRVYRRDETGLLRGWPLSEGEPARVWERHPTGRWRVASPAARPVLPLEILAPAMAGARGLRMPWSPDRWLDLEEVDKGFPEGFGSRIALDWGEEVTGLLSLDLASDDGTPGLLHVGTGIPDHETPADALVVPVPGRSRWVDVHPRTFRYALLTGLDLRGVPEVWLIEPAIARQMTAPDSGPPGVFGIAPLREASLAEERIRRRLQPGTAADP